jgi:glycosyltransferase involved in cell wall biosynthesis
VTILMPVRNGERWLETALASVAAQTVRDFELVVVDNGSTDRTPAILVQACSGDERIVTIAEPQPGISSALNTGLGIARAALTARLDADDVALPHRLERQLHFMAQHPGVGLLGSWAAVVDEGGRVRGHRRPPTEHDDLLRVLAASNPFIHSSIMFRTELVRRLGGYRHAFEVSEDYDLWLRISETTRLANLPDELVLYRRVQGKALRKKVLNQAFAVHLAQCSARVRRATGVDPADALKKAPDWWDEAADRSFFAAEARLFRLIGLADRDVVISRDLSTIPRPAPSELCLALNGTDRKLARLAIVNLLRSGARQPRAALRLIESLAKLAHLRVDPRSLEPDRAPA